MVRTLAPKAPPRDQSLAGQVISPLPGHWANKQKEKKVHDTVYLLLNHNLLFNKHASHPPVAVAQQTSSLSHSHLLKEITQSRSLFFEALQQTPITHPSKSRKLPISISENVSTACSTQHTPPI